MAILETISITDERSALNALLVSVGESPLPASVSVDTASTSYSDIITAAELLRDTLREVLSMAWKFNSFRGVELKPTATYAWKDSANITTTLNVFKLPTDVLHWTLTGCQQNLDLDMVVRPAEKYREGSVAPNILYDRTWNRDGADASKHPYLYLDVRRLYPFSAIPEVAIKYIIRLSSLRYAQNILGDPSRSQFNGAQVDLALRNLKRDQGEEEVRNINNNPQVSAWSGNRPNVKARPLRRVKRGPF